MSASMPNFSGLWWRAKERNPSALARTVLACTRQLLREHLSTDGLGVKYPCLGALVNRIPGLQNLVEGKCSWDSIEEDWKVYFGGWQAVKKDEHGPFLFVGRDAKASGNWVVRFHGRLSKRKHDPYQPNRPAAFLVLRYLMGTAPTTLDGSITQQPVDEALLRDWYRASLREAYDFEDTERFMHFLQAFADAFDRLPGECSRAELLALGKQCSSLISGQEELVEKWTEGIIETLEGIYVLQLPKRGSEFYFEGYRIVFRAVAALLNTAIFAKSTGNLGLDDLLLGGLLIPENRPFGLGGSTAPGQRSPSATGGGLLAMSISGVSGAGKTSIGLAIATQVAARGGLCIYLHLTQEASSILRLIASFYRRQTPFIEVTSRYEDLSEAVQRCQENSRGLLWLESASSDSEEMRRRMYDCVKDPALHYFGNKEKMVVFDSIGLGHLSAEDKAAWKTFLVESTKWLRTMGCSAIYVIERDTDDGRRFEEFLVDLSIRLQAVPAAVGAYILRTIEVSKSRFQLTHRGTHSFRLRSDEGVRISLSSAASLAARRRRERQLPETFPPINPGIPGFAQYFDRSANTIDDGNSDVSRQRVSFWRRESLAAIIGPPGVSKTAIAEAFVSQIDSTEDDDPPVANLVIHLADDRITRDSVVQPGRQARWRTSSFGLRYDAPGDFMRSEGEKEEFLITHLFFRAAYYRAGDVLSTVEATIRDMRWEQRRIDRAVIIDTANIPSSFPLLGSDEDPMFLPALFDLLNGHRITTLVVHSVDYNDTNDKILKEIRSLADVSVVAESKIYRGRRCIGIYVADSYGETHDRGEYELKIGRDGVIRIENSFDLVANFNHEILEPGRVYINLDAGTNLQERFFNDLARNLERLNPANYTVSVRPSKDSFSRRNIAPATISLHKDLHLVIREAFRFISFPSLMDSDHESEHEPLWSRRDAWKETLGDLVYADPSLPKTNSVPYFLNPSFLVTSREFLEFVEGDLRNKKWQIRHEEDDVPPNYSWNDLIEAAEAFIQKRGTKPEGMALFDFADETPETLNCLFLEILLSLCGDKFNWDDFRDNFNISGACHQAVLEAIVILRRLLAQRWTGHVELGPWKSNRLGDARTNVQFNVDPNAVFSRHWYSTYRQMLNDFQESDSYRDKGLQLLRLPGGVWGNGDWCFAALKGSLGSETGANVILDHFVNSEQSHAMMAHGVGLTPMKRFYERRAILPSSGVFPSWFHSYISRPDLVIYRGRIGGYRVMGPILAAHLAFILALPAFEDIDVEHPLLEERIRTCYELLPWSR